MRPALADLRQSIDRIRNIANDIVVNTPAALADAQLRARHETMRAAAVVLLSGFIESFMRATAEDFVGSVCGVNPTFTSLPKEMRNAHYEDGARILADAAAAHRKSEPHSWIIATREDIARRLHSIASPPYELIWEAFAETSANPGSKSVGAFVKKFGVDSAWPKIGTKAQARIAHFNENALTTALNNLITIRNECAHTGWVATLPAPSDLLGYCDLVEAIAEAIVEVLEDHLLAIAPGAVAPVASPPPLPLAAPTLSPATVPASAPHPRRPAATVRGRLATGLLFVLRPIVARLERCVEDP